MSFPTIDNSNKFFSGKNQTPTVDHSVLLSEYAKMMIGSFAFCEKFLRDSGKDAVLIKWSICSIQIHSR